MKWGRVATEVHRNTVMVTEVRQAKPQIFRVLRHTPQVPYSITLIIGGEDITNPTLTAAWDVRRRKWVARSHRYFEKEHLFTLRDAMLEQDLTEKFEVQASLDDLFQELKDGPLERRRMRCSYCGRPWNCVVRASSGPRVNSVCNECGHGATIVERHLLWDDEDEPVSTPTPAQHTHMPGLAKTRATEDESYPEERPSRKLRTALHG